MHSNILNANRTRLKIVFYNECFSVTLYHRSDLCQIKQKKGCIKRVNSLRGNLDLYI